METRSIYPVLGVIPARGGSKGLPGKNVRDLAGKPLIAHTLEQARNSTLLARTIVSTEEPSIMQIAQEWGGDVPFLRPFELAQDDTPMLPVLTHVLAELDGTPPYTYNAVVILQPTSPLRRSEDIDRGLELLDSTGADTVVTVTDLEKLSHPYLVQRFLSEPRLRLEPFLSNANYEHYAHANRSLLPPAVRLNAAIYAVRRGTLMKQGAILGRDTRGLLMDRWRSIDVDTEDDFKLAEAILRAFEEV